MAREPWRDRDLMFAATLGTPVDPNSAVRPIQITAQKAGIADVGVRTLRHSAAVARGVHPQAVGDVQDRIRCGQGTAAPGLGLLGSVDPRPGRRAVCRAIVQSGAGVFRFSEHETKRKWRGAWSR